MGTTVHFYFGPLVKVTKIKETLTKNICSCPNSSCLKYNKEIHSNFCDFCGSKVEERSEPYVDSVNPLFTDICYKNGIDNLFSFAIEDDDYFYFIPNQHVPENIKSYYEDEKYSQFVLDIPNVSEQIELFKNWDVTKQFIKFLDENFENKYIFDYLAIKYCY